MFDSYNSFRSLGSDNNSGIHPRILEALINANVNHAVGYGSDPLTSRAEELLRDEFGSDIETTFCFGGTGGNVLSLACAAKFGAAVITSSLAHIFCDECGAMERSTGLKLIGITTENGKLSPETITETVLLLKGSIHVPQPGIVSITQPNELGFLYSMEELAQSREICKQNSLLLHIDGARLSNAAVALNTTFREIAIQSGADVITFGGTKNGLMFGEAVIVLNPELHGRLKYLQKQFLQLYSKNRFVACQFIPYLEERLWFENAQHSNLMARRLKDLLLSAPNCRTTREVSVNMIFFTAELELLMKAQEETFFYIVDKKIPEARFVTSFDTTTEDLERAVSSLKNR